MEGPQHPLVVPVRLSPTGSITPLTARLSGGERVGVAYTSVEALEAAQPEYAWAHLGERGLRQLLVGVGVRRLQVDPQIVMAALPSSAGHAVGA